MESPQKNTNESGMHRRIESPRNLYNACSETVMSPNLKNSESAFEKHYGSQSNHSNNSDPSHFPYHSTSLKTHLSVHSSSEYSTSLSGSHTPTPRFSKMSTILKNRSKCVDITSMAFEIASFYTFSEALVVSYHLFRIVYE